ncbi:MAG TPA: FAD-dependent monooxygenase [Burkholderiales bacterium]|nr:FAD-dependent monooxygenase [Burkholderiales bacterium]
MHVLIAGAGIGGLTAALALLKRGVDVDVYEQATELKEVGAGVQLSANGTRVLHLLGVAEALRALSCEAAGKEVRLWSTGETWKLFDLGAESVARYGFPYFTVYRPDLLTVLADAVRAEKRGAIHLGMKVTGFTQETSRVKLQVQHREVQGEALIGADGVHSGIRQALFGPDKPAFTGNIAWRGIAPMEKLPARMARLVGTNWIGPGGHIVHYPLRGGTLMNFVGIRERADWQIESWSTRGTTEEVLADFRGWNEDIQTLIRNLATPYKWALMVREPMPKWSVGRVTLLGDACHSMLPMLAQGAVMAIEDGYILARCLAETPQVPAALARYEDARRERTRKVVEGSAANAKRFHNPQLADPAEAKKYVDREWEPGRIAERYEWLFRYDVNEVPV